MLQGRKQQLITKREKLKDAIQQDKSARLSQKNWDNEGKLVDACFLHLSEIRYLTKKSLFLEAVHKILSHLYKQ